MTRAPSHATGVSGSVVTPGEFDYLDGDDFRRHYTTPGQPHRITFALEGIHCTSCLFRVESLAGEVEGVRSIRLDMSRHTADVEIEPGASFARVAQRIKDAGYPPQPVAPDQVEDGGRGRARKSLLIRIGVAGAATGNIMLLSTSLYSGAQQSNYATLFEWLTFVLFLPVLFYAAVPFYANSWHAIRARRSSIDVPIVGALFFGTGLGLYHLVVGRGDIYFDSLAVLVFLLLCARLVLFGLQDRFLSPDRLRAFFEARRVRVRDKKTGKTEERHVDDVQIGDEVVVHRGERIPVDGRLVDGGAFVNAAVLTGEPLPQRVMAGQKLFAGTELTSDEAVLQVEQVGKETRIGALLEETERGILGKTPLVSFTDRAAQWFSVSVLALGVLFALVYSVVDVQEAINRALALVILACPCALALATPLTQSLALKKAARGGCLIKKAEAFEKLYQVDRVFLDKTGTLTYGEIVLDGWWPGAPDPVERGIVYALERESSHPIGHVLALEASRGGTRPAAVVGRREAHGVGVSGDFEGHHYELRSLKGERELELFDLDWRGGQTYVGFYRDGQLVRVARFTDRVRETSAGAVSRLRAKGLDVYLVTGDARGPAAATAEVVGIDPANVLYGKSPEDKRDLLARYPRALMAGDGVNDAVALANAHVSVAVHGSMETSFRAADIYLTQPGLEPLVDLHDLSKATIGIIRRNLVFSLVYNSIGATLALLGFINPLVAAVLMPASSITVVLSSVIGNRAWRRFGRLAASRSAPTLPDLSPTTLASRGGRA